MPTRNINLTIHFDRFIERRIASGQYGSASEIVRDALRLLENRQNEQRVKLDGLRKAAKVGFGAVDQGQGIKLQSAKELDAFLNEIAEEVKSARSRKGDSRA